MNLCLPFRPLRHHLARPKSDFYTLRGQNTTIRYWLVAASESLQTEIEARTQLKMRRTDRSEDE